MPKDGAYRRAASYGFSEEFKDYLDRNPLLVDRSNAIGRVLTRSKIEPLTDGQIALVTTFADQAVIAIENVACSMKSRTRAGSLKSRADTSRNFSPI